MLVYLLYLSLLYKGQSDIHVSVVIFDAKMVWLWFPPFSDHFFHENLYFARPIQTVYHIETNERMTLTKRSQRHAIRDRVPHSDILADSPRRLPSQIPI